MSRLKIWSVAVVAVALAICLALPGSSSATVGECVNVGAGNGVYENSACTVHSETKSSDAWSVDECRNRGPTMGDFSDNLCVLLEPGGEFQEARCQIAPVRGSYMDTFCRTPEANGPYELVWLLPRRGKTNNLQWAVDDKILTETSEKAEPVYSAQSTQEIKPPSIIFKNVVCKTVKLIEGADIEGSVNPNPGTSKYQIQYGECEVSGLSGCEINGKSGLSKEAKITTEALTGKLVYATKSAAEKELAEESSESTAELLLKPSTGSVFLTFKLTKCPIETTITVDGQLLAKLVGKSEIQAESHKMETLESGTYWENNSSKETVSKTVEKMICTLGSIAITGKLNAETKGHEPWYVTN